MSCLAWPIQLPSLPCLPLGLAPHSSPAQPAFLNHRRQDREGLKEVRGLPRETSPSPGLAGLGSKEYLNPWPVRAAAPLAHASGLGAQHRSRGAGSSPGHGRGVQGQDHQAPPPAAAELQGAHARAARVCSSQAVCQASSLLSWPQGTDCSRTDRQK